MSTCMHLRHGSYEQPLNFDDFTKQGRDGNSVCAPTIQQTHLQEVAILMPAFAAVGITESPSRAATTLSLPSAVPMKRTATSPGLSSRSLLRTGGNGSGSGGYPMACIESLPLLWQLHECLLRGSRKDGPWKACVSLLAMPRATAPAPIALFMPQRNRRRLCLCCCWCCAASLKFRILSFGTPCSESWTLVTCDVYSDGQMVSPNSHS